MDWFEAVVLGVVQGVTEFLPISSNAHLRIVAEAAGWDDPGAAFTAVTQFGTLAAVLVYFWRDIVSVLAALARGCTEPRARQDPDFRMGVTVALGTIPIVIFGVLLRDQIETSFRSLSVIAATLIGFSIIMELADRRRGDRTMEDMTTRRGVLIGCAQALALIPGVSRSGATISMARVLGFAREEAARFSFLLSIPAITLSGLFEARHLLDANGLEIGPTMLATLVAFVTGYASIAFLLRYLTRHSLTVFVVYRIAVGIAVLVWLA